MTVSEIVQLREQIAAEYMAAQWGLNGLAHGTSRHDFISARMEKMGEGHQHLTVLVGEQQAAELVAETLVSLPEKPERHAILDVLTHLRGKTEETAHLTDYIQDMWETVDILKKEFGEEDTQKIINAPRIPVL